MIRGTEDQVAYAQQLVYEKVSGSIGGIPPPGFFGDQAYVPSSTGSSSGANPWTQYGADQTAAWAAYYQQYYAAAGIPTAQPAAAAPAASAAPVNGSAAGGQGGQTDYTQAWIDYYRSMGMHDQAEQIAKQSQQKGSSPTETATSPNGANGGSTVPGSNGSTDPSADPYANWYQYQNYANYYAAAAAGNGESASANPSTNGND